MLGQTLEHLYESLRTRLKLGKGNLQVLQHVHLKLRQRQHKFILVNRHS